MSTAGANVTSGVNLSTSAVPDVIANRATPPAQLRHRQRRAANDSAGVTSPMTSPVTSPAPVRPPLDEYADGTQQNYYIDSPYQYEDDEYIDRDMLNYGDPPETPTEPAPRDVTSSVTSSAMSSATSTAARTPSTPTAASDADGEYDNYYDYGVGDNAEAGGTEIDMLLMRFLPLILHAIASAVCFYFARVACKLCMQAFAFRYHGNSIYNAPITIQSCNPRIQKV